MIEAAILVAASAIFILTFTVAVMVFEAWSERRRARRLADRLAHGEDRYFEELRELQAYAPLAGQRPGFARLYAVNCVKFILLAAAIAAFRWLMGLVPMPLA